MPKSLAIALTGLLSLAIAMGIGRFAFTPLLPMMLQDGVVDLQGASALATVNYVGYWIGAMACALQPAIWRRLGIAKPLAHTIAVRTGLIATVFLTLCMALPLPALWPLARFMAGLASAFVFVYVSGWCMSRLGEMGAASIAGLIYVGPGLGITVSGLAATAMVATGFSAALGWAVFAALALVLAVLAWPQLQGTVAPADPPRGAAAPTGGALVVFTLAYGLAGFGYIVTATFLPVIAREVLPGSIWLDLFWPLFGLGVASGALLTLRLSARHDRRHLLMVCYGLQAAGVVLSVWWPTVAGFALGSLLLGLPFTAITLFSVQEARRLRPQDASAFIGVITATYGLGQIIGPPMVAWLAARSASTQAAFTLSLEIAASALLLGVGIFWGLVRRYPLAANVSR
ncbi:MAG: YbfB/YjiJ family MFS transporter [Ramlibacter sp.]